MATFVAARAFADKRARDRDAAVAEAADFTARAEAARAGGGHLVVSAFYAVEAAKAAAVARELGVAA